MSNRHSHKKPHPLVFPGLRPLAPTLQQAPQSVGVLQTLQCGLQGEEHQMRRQVHRLSRSEFGVRSSPQSPGSQGGEKRVG